MIIFLILILILLIILFAKIKIKIFFTLKNFEYYYCVDIFIYNLRIIKTDKNTIKKYAKKIKPKIKNQNKIQVSKIIRKIKIEELNIDLKIGLLGISPTIFSIPIISTIIASILPLLKTEKDKIKYSIQPVYNKLAIQMKVTGTISFRIIDVITLRQT
ncbi:MAG: hypothetical protein J6B87_02270 [Clostridia bacterium]|nr:hypothetical protein [Clostridia bacterium]